MSDSGATPKRDLRQEITDAMIAALEKGTLHGKGHGAPERWKCPLTPRPRNDTAAATLRPGQIWLCADTGLSDGLRSIDLPPKEASAEVFWVTNWVGWIFGWL
jgi:hypothetical protein